MGKIAMHGRSVAAPLHHFHCSEAITLWRFIHPALAARIQQDLDAT